MEPWKVLLLVAAIPALASVWLSYDNGNTLKAQIAEREAQEGRVQRTEENLVRKRDELANTQMEIRTLEQDTEAKNTQLAATETQVSEMNLRKQQLTDDISAADDKIASFNQLKDIGTEIETIDRQIAEVEQESMMLQDDINNASNLLAVANAKQDETQREIDRRESESKNRKAGIMSKDLNSTIKAAYNDWGFVVISAGDADGLVPAATLDVSRGGKPICKLLVTEIEPTQAVADIIPGSLLPGQMVQVGDSVTKLASVKLQ